VRRARNRRHVSAYPLNGVNLRPFPREGFPKFNELPLLKAAFHGFSNTSFDGPIGQQCSLSGVKRTSPNVRWRLRPGERILRAVSNFLIRNSSFDQTGFSVAVKSRGHSPKPWSWEIYRAGRNSPIECSPTLYETVAAANRAGKRALREFLSDVPS